MRMKKCTAMATAAFSTAMLAVAFASPANAAGYNWSDQMGPDGQGCFAWTTWSQYMVQPHVYQQPGNPNTPCWLQVTHLAWDSAGNLVYRNVWPADGQTQDTTGRGTVVDGPNWYYGNNGNSFCVLFTFGEGLTSSKQVWYC